MAVAQPTPLFTMMAAVGQLSMQAPHSMQAEGLTSSANPDAADEHAVRADLAAQVAVNAEMRDRTGEWWWCRN